MAGKVRDQAVHTRRLADIAERQLESTTTPVVRVMRVGAANQADIIRLVEAGSETLTVRIENRGATAAQINECTMHPGGTGKLAEAELESPVLEPGGEWDVDFTPSAADRQHHERGDDVLLQLVYEAAGIGVRYRRRTVLKPPGRQGPEEPWRILREEGPSLLT
jgi:hypothetical protein